MHDSHFFEKYPIIGGRTIKVVAFVSLSSLSLQMNNAGLLSMDESLKNDILEWRPSKKRKKEKNQLSQV